MSCNSKLNLNDSGFLEIEYPLYNKKEISFEFEDEEGEFVTPVGNYKFSISKDANYDQILASFTNSNGLEILGNQIIVSIKLDDSCETGKKFFELKSITNEETIVSGTFLILQKLIP